MKHWMVPSRVPGCKAKWIKNYRRYISMPLHPTHGWKELQIWKTLCFFCTCFKETGKVIFPENSGLFTISLHISLHDLQTAAQATTCLRAGHTLSLFSSLMTTSRNSSGGRLAQRLFWITRGWSCKSWTDPWDLPRWWPGSLTSKLRRDKLPNPSLTSRTILRNDITGCITKPWLTYIQCCVMH